MRPRYRWLLVPAGIALAVLLLLALAPDGGTGPGRWDGGPTSPVDAGPLTALVPVPPHEVQLANLGAFPVALRLRDGSGRVVWGPFALEAVEQLRLRVCGGSPFTLEATSAQRRAPWSRATSTLGTVRFSEDRWSEGDPRVQPPTSDGGALPDAGSCPAAGFEVRR